jgi:signal transduction histidine kinase
MATNLLRNELVKAVVLNSRDVTEQTEAEIELEKYRSHLEDLVERRTRELTAALETEKQAVEQQKTFISMVSHEFRTPLTIIDGNAQIIQKRGGTLTPEVLELRAGTIRSAVGRLVGLIETILSAHMLESGMLTITPAPCDVSAVIRAVCDDHLGVAPHHHITMDLSAMPPMMNVDEKMIRQVMVNLISNAVKYSPPHSGQDQLVEVRGYKTATDVVIEVQDHGVGIPENEISRIFTRYFRASTSGGIAGSGLGLSLVKQFIELHHGKVEIRSIVGAGTTLTLKIPLAAVIN